MGLPELAQPLQPRCDLVFPGPPVSSLSSENHGHTPRFLQVLSAQKAPPHGPPPRPSRAGRPLPPAQRLRPVPHVGHRWPQCFCTIPPPVVTLRGSPRLLVTTLSKLSTETQGSNRKGSVWDQASRGTPRPHGHHTKEALSVHGSQGKRVAPSQCSGLPCSVSRPCEAVTLCLKRPSGAHSKHESRAQRLRRSSEHVVFG